MSFLKDWYNYIFFHNPKKLHDPFTYLDEEDDDYDELDYYPYTTTTTTTTINKPFLSNLRHAMRKG